VWLRIRKEREGLGAGVTKDMQIPFIITAATKTATSRLVGKRKLLDYPLILNVLGRQRNNT